MNIAKILKKCPKGTELYSPVFGEVKLYEVCHNSMINVIIKNNHSRGFYKDGSFSEYGECVLFPSKDQRDWNKFIVPDQVPDQETKHQFKPFDKVLVRDCDIYEWKCDLFSRLGDNDGVFICLTAWWSQCIPYEGNEHLLGTTNKPKQ